MGINNDEKRNRQGIETIRNEREEPTGDRQKINSCLNT